MKLSTAKLQGMLAKSIKGASFDKSIPRTCMIAIEVNNNMLTLITTDGANYLYIKEQVKAKDFYVVVNADVFSKLIAKTTCDEVELKLTKDYLEVTGNGTYKIALELDADGTPAKLPDPIANKNWNDMDCETIHLSAVDTIINVAKPSLMSENLNVPCYTGYYIGDNVIATDSTQICGIGMKLFNEDVLLSPALLDLVALGYSENIRVYRENDTITFISGDCIVYGNVMSYLDDYDTTSIMELLNGDFGTKCIVSKLDFLSVLDRLSLFVGKYEKNQIVLTFTKSGIEITSKSSNAVELIAYKSTDNFEEYTCVINIEMLQTQLKAYTADEVELWYKNESDNAIKLVDGSITQIIALCD